MLLRISYVNAYVAHSLQNARRSEIQVCETQVDVNKRVAYLMLLYVGAMRRPQDVYYICVCVCLVFVYGDVRKLYKRFANIYIRKCVVVVCRLWMTVPPTPNHKHLIAVSVCEDGVVSLEVFCCFLNGVSGQYYINCKRTHFLQTIIAIWWFFAPLARWVPR